MLLYVFFVDGKRDFGQVQFRICDRLQEKRKISTRTPSIFSERETNKSSVGDIQGQGKAAIESTIKSTPVNNSDRSWNCQNWIGDALKKLSDQPWITNDPRSKAIDAMAEVIVYAPDDS